MSIEIPDLRGARVELLSVCGRINTKATKTDKALKKWAADHSERFYHYEYKLDSGLLFCHVCLDDYKKFVHLHIDLETTTKKAPRDFKESIGIDDLLEPFFKRMAIVYVVGDLIVSLAELPEIVQAVSQIAITENDVTLKMSGCTLSVEGSPLTTLSWHPPEDNKKATLRVTGKRELAVTSSYLADCAKFVQSFSHLFVKGSDSND